MHLSLEHEITSLLLLMHCFLRIQAALYITWELGVGHQYWKW